MRSHTSYLAIVAILGILLVAGCEDTGSKDAGIGSPYIGGTQGITANFESFGIVDAGLPTIYEDETFPVEITLRNKGEENIDAGDVTIRIRGISEQDYDGLSFEESNADNIEKVSTTNTAGGEETIDMGDAKYSHNIITAFYDATVYAEYQYPYATHVAIPQVCFKEDLQDTTVCNVEESKQHFSSGAPIKVTAAAEKRAGAGIIAIEYTVENLGGGDVTAPDKEFDSRHGQIAFSLDENSNPSDWECKLGGEENGGRLIDGKGTIRCKLNSPMEENTLYTKQIDLTISYIYRDLIQQKVRINNKE